MASNSAFGLAKQSKASVNVTATERHFHMYDLNEIELDAISQHGRRASRDYAIASFCLSQSVALFFVYATGTVAEGTLGQAIVMLGMPTFLINSLVFFGLGHQHDKDRNKIIITIKDQTVVVRKRKTTAQ
jgi:hypothetical protein